jgi:hypothetical protein
MNQDESTRINAEASDTAVPMTEAEERKTMGRRALIAAAGLGVVGAGLYEAPKVLEGAGKLTEQQIQNAINYGRQQLANELINLEEVGVEVAVDVASITHDAVNLFVVPIANLLSGLTEITLDIADGAVIKAKDFTQLLNIQIDALSFLHTLFGQWKQGVAQFPRAVQTLNNTDTQAAKKYLSALQQKLEHEKAGK